MNVKEIMSSKVATCDASDSLQKVALLMEQNDCGAVPVVDGTGLCGIITDRDIVLRAVAKGKNALDLDAKSCMTSNVASVSEDCSLRECTNLIEKQQIRRVVVTNGDGEICGIVAQADVALNAPEKETGDVVKKVSK